MVAHPTASEGAGAPDAGSSFEGLRAVFVNCTLKPSPQVSHTQGLMDVSIRLMRDNGVRVDTVRLVDHDVAFGVYPDMREHGWASDAWPGEVWPLIDAADILVVGGPIWLGDNSSVTRRVAPAVEWGTLIPNLEGCVNSESATRVATVVR